jgi:hypothetical protein
MIMVAALLIMLFMTNYSVMQQKSVTNQYASDQAYEAAEAGLEFGVAYLQRNKATVIASPSSGFINYGSSDSNITNVTQANNSRFSIVYTNPNANNYNLILITATGTSSDTTSARTIKQLFQYKPILLNTPTVPSTVLGSVALGGTATITNTEGSTSIVAGSGISYNGTSSSTSTTGSSDIHTAGPDIQPNNSTINAMNTDQFFQSFFGTTTSTVKNMIQNYYPAGSNPNINGMTGTSIWVDDSLTLASSTVIGSPTAPVLLIVNGNFNLNGNVTIYGFVFVQGLISNITGTPNIIGGFASSGGLSLLGNADIGFSSSTLNALSQNTGVYAKVPGSWRDY